jgi:hypothetical protein
VVGTLLSSRLPDQFIRKVLGITLMLLGTNFMVNPVKAKAPQPAPAPVSAPARIASSEIPAR